MQYRFSNTKHEHLHQLNVDGEWKNLTGTSGISKVLGSGGALAWWASGLAVASMGWIKRADSRTETRENVKQNERDRKKSANYWKKKLNKMSASKYLQLLDDAYKAHSVSFKNAAVKGTDLHAE